MDGLKRSYRGNSSIAFIGMDVRMRESGQWRGRCKIEEEWLYILSGRGIADGEFEVGAGDFMGFRTPSVGHQLRNPFDADLVYLTGGENLALKIAVFPKLGKRMARRSTGAEIYVADGKPFGPLGG